VGVFYLLKFSPGPYSKYYVAQIPSQILSHCRYYLAKDL